jgi:hypothetical protein
MNLLRKAAVTAASTALVTIAGAVSGLGSSAAQAYDLAASNSEVTIALDANETGTIAASPDPENPRDANEVCRTAVPSSFADAPFAPMNDLNCASSLYECAVMAVEADRSAVTARFEWLEIKCVY